MSPLQHEQYCRLFDLGGYPPCRSSRVLHATAFVFVSYLDGLLHRCCARFKGAFVCRANVADVDVHIGRNRRPAITAICDHYYRIVANTGTEPLRILYVSAPVYAQPISNC